MAHANTSTHWRPQSNYAWCKLRLTQRRRDSAQEVAARLARNARLSKLHADCTIVNQSELAHAGRQLVDYLASTIAEPSAASVSPLRSVISP